MASHGRGVRDSGGGKTEVGEFLGFGDRGYFGYREIIWRVVLGRKYELKNRKKEIENLKMQSTSYAAAAASSFCYCHQILQFPRPHRRKKPTTSFSLLRTNQLLSKQICSLSLHTTSNCSKEQQNLHHNTPTNFNSYPDHKNIFFDSDTGNNDYPEAQKEETGLEAESKSSPVLCGLLSNMWWTDLKAVVGQRINVEGVLSSVSVILKDRHLALPHVLVPDVRYIDWAELHRRGFRGVVFDKDNTITAPYSMTLWEPVSSSIDRCKAVFGCDIAVFSNSSGNF